MTKLKKISARLQRMRYCFYGMEAVERICLVDETHHYGEFTLCGNAIPDSTIEFDDCEAVGEEFIGSIKDITCPNCLRRINYIKSLK